MSDPGQLYRDTILKHAADPVGYKEAIEATHQHEAFNPLCGDRILLKLRVTGDTVEAVAFDGDACAICLASASLLCSEMSGRPAASLADARDRLARALDRDGSDGEIGALEPLLGVRPYPSRIQCAMLPWDAGVRALAGD